MVLSCTTFMEFFLFCIFFSFFFFFFSSRRRHTRWNCDWGSDVCSSDLIQLVGLVNDVSLRGLIPGELAKGFGFLQSKPRSALSPVLVTPDELGADWKDDKLHRPMRSEERRVGKSVDLGGGRIIKKKS